MHTDLRVPRKKHLTYSACEQRLLLPSSPTTALDTVTYQLQRACGGVDMAYEVAYLSSTGSLYVREEGGAGEDEEKGGRVWSVWEGLERLVGAERVGNWLVYREFRRRGFRVVTRRQWVEMGRWCEEKRKKRMKEDEEEEEVSMVLVRTMWDSVTRAWDWMERNLQPWLPMPIPSLGPRATPNLSPDPAPTMTPVCQSSTPRACPDSPSSSLPAFYAYHPTTRIIQTSPDAAAMCPPVLTPADYAIYLRGPRDSLCNDPCFDDPRGLVAMLDDRSGTVVVFQCGGHVTWKRGKGKKGTVGRPVVEGLD